MKYSPRKKPPAEQLNWAQVWVCNLIEYNRWSLVTSTPIGYYVYAYLNEE